MIIKISKYKNSLGWGIKFFISRYVGQPRKFEALLLKLGKKGIWFFRNKRIFDSWPSTN